MIDNRDDQHDYLINLNVQSKVLCISVHPCCQSVKSSPRIIRNGGLSQMLISGSLKDGPTLRAPGNTGTPGRAGTPGKAGSFGMPGISGRIPLLLPDSDDCSSFNGLQDATATTAAKQHRIRVFMFTLRSELIFDSSS